MDFGWAAALGGISGDRGYAVAVDASGNVYTTGYFQGTVDFDPGPSSALLTSEGSYDIFVSKLDASANFVWAKRMGATDYDIGYGIAVDGSGNVYTTGYFRGTADFDPGPGTANLTSAGYQDVFVSKLDASGERVGAWRMGGVYSDIGHGIAVDASGRIYTTGFFFGAADFNPGPGTANLISPVSNDIFVSMLDSSGNYLWAKRIGGTSNDSGASIAVDASGNVYTTGYFEGTADFDPGPGTVNFVSVGDKDIFVSKLDASGILVWARHMGGVYYDEGLAIAVGAAGNVYTTGYFLDTVDFDPGPGTANLTRAGSYNSDTFVSTLDALGNYVWARGMGGTNSEAGNGIGVDASGNVYTTGYFSGTADFDPGPGTALLTGAGYADMFVSELDASGDYVWANAMGGTDYNSGLGIAVDASDNVYTTGYFSGTVDFDPGAGAANLTSVGGPDIFVSKLTLVDLSAPSVSITGPTAANAYATGASSLNLSGTAADNVSVTQVTWSNDRGGSGIAAGTTSWSIAGIALIEGENVIEVTAHDAAGNTATDSLTVTYCLDLALALRDRFFELDADSDGRLSLAESGTGAAEFNGLDPNPNNGYLTLAELLALTVGPVGIATQVWVDFAWTSTEDGQASTPFNTLDEAAAFVAPGGELKVEGETGRTQTGAYALDKNMTLTAAAGTVRIGATTAP